MKQGERKALCASQIADYTWWHHQQMHFFLLGHCGHLKLVHPLCNSVICWVNSRYSHSSSMPKNIHKKPLPLWIHTNKHSKWTSISCYPPHLFIPLLALLLLLPKIYLAQEKLPSKTGRTGLPSERTNGDNDGLSRPRTWTDVRCSAWISLYIMNNIIYPISAKFGRRTVLPSRIRNITHA